MNIVCKKWEAVFLKQLKPDGLQMIDEGEGGGCEDIGRGT